MNLKKLLKKEADLRKKEKKALEKTKAKPKSPPVVDLDDLRKIDRKIKKMKRKKLRQQILSFTPDKLFNRRCKIGETTFQLALQAR